MSLILFSRPIHSGKTTALLQWCDQQKNVHGILMPDINGSRKILDIRTKEIFDIQCTDPANTNEPLTAVGKFHFYTAAFEKANLILINALQRDPAWLIIDEAGKLELDGRGFYNALENIIPLYKDTKQQGNLVITIRDSLCEEVIHFFRIENYRLIHQVEELA
ncbi:MAG TPA: nucleoside-triphosphatase [Ferruginibacter sp.]|nr:nucleoside-triphosphatase [Ferruginibacter sp.]